MLTVNDILGNKYLFIVSVDKYLLANKMVCVDQKNKRVKISQDFFDGPNCINTLKIITPFRPLCFAAPQASLPHHTFILALLLILILLLGLSSWA